MTVPFALSVHTFIKDVGADAGFASIIGLALLVLLYFAQMRETRTLRDRLEEASGRVDHLENRLAHLARVQSSQTIQPPVAPAPQVAVRPMGTALATLRRPIATAVAGGTGLYAGAPVGLAGPALMSATKLIPTAIPTPSEPAAVPGGAPARTTPGVPAEAPAPVAAPVLAPAGVPSAVPDAAPVAVPAVAAATAVPPPVAAPQSNPAVVGATMAEDTMLVAPSTVAAAGNGHARVSLGDEPPVAPPPSGRRPARVPPPRGGRRLPPVSDGPPRGRSRARRIISVLIVGLALIAGVVAVVIVLTHSTAPPKTPAVKHHKHRAPVTHRRRHLAVTFNPANVTVAVLNGTATFHLADDVGTKLSADGYKVPKATIANASVQTQTTTVVGYQPGHAVDASQVAKALGLSPSAAQPADSTAIQNCTNAPAATGATTPTTTCSADVIITVGADLQSLAQNTGSG